MTSLTLVKVGANDASMPAGAIVAKANTVNQYPFLDRIFADHPQSLGHNRLKRYQVIFLFNEGKRVLQAFNNKEIPQLFLNPKRKKEGNRKLLPKFQIFIEDDGEKAHVVAKIFKKAVTNGLSGSNKHFGKGYLITIYRTGEVIGGWIARMTLSNLSNPFALPTIKNEIIVLDRLAQAKIPNHCPLIANAIYTNRKNIEKSVLVFPLLSCDLVVFNNLCLHHKIYSGSYTPIIALKILETLSACHQLGLVHGDIKLDNILVTHSPFTDVPPQITDVKVCDWGHADDIKAKNRNPLLGTFAYFSPERLENYSLSSHPLPTINDDIWSFGRLLLDILYNCDSPDYQLLANHERIERILEKKSSFIRGNLDNSMLMKLKQDFSPLNPPKGLVLFDFVCSLELTAEAFSDTRNVVTLQDSLASDFNKIINHLCEKLENFKIFPSNNLKIFDNTFILFTDLLYKLVSHLDYLINANWIMKFTVSLSLKKLSVLLLKHAKLYQTVLRKSVDLPFHGQEQFPGHAATLGLIKEMFRASPKPLQQLLAEYKANLAKGKVKVEFVEEKASNGPIVVLDKGDSKSKPAGTS